MTAILGVSAWYHDSAAVLLIDGCPVAAAQEERFSRIRHDPGFPVQAIEYCLETAGISPEDLDFAGFYEKPVRHFDRLNESWLAGVPFGYPAFRLAMPQWLNHKLKTPAHFSSALKARYRGRYVFVDHHESHAASAFFASPFQEAAILTIDGVGEWTTTTIGIGQGNRISRLHSLQFPHSLGLLYSAFTEYLGFRVNSGEYKVMGLAPYGSPVYADHIRRHLIDLRDDGSFRLDQTYFSYIAGLRMTGSRFHQLFGGAPRRPESEITQRHKDIAASIQLVTEEATLKLASFARRITGRKNLVLAGGVALNCVANGRLLRTSPLDPLWIQPAAGDAGGAVGTAMFIHHQLLDQPRHVSALKSSGIIPSDQMSFARLGPQFSNDHIRNMLSHHEARWTEYPDDKQLCEAAAELLSQQNVIGWFQGRMEYGPRALGGRSILADARSPLMQEHLNRSIKQRENFRPFAPAILQSEVHQWFDVRSDEHSPYMLWTAILRQDLPPMFEWTDRMPAWTKEGSSSPFPAVTHTDFSARLQTVTEHQDPLFHLLLTSFQELTRCPLLVNTSFNVRGEPLVCTPADAWNCFCSSELDALVLGRFLIVRNKQPADFADEIRLHRKPFPAD